MFGISLRQLSATCFHNCQTVIFYTVIQWLQCRLSKLKASVSNKISDRKIKSSKDILQYYKPTTKSYPCSNQNCTLVILEEVECSEWICSDFPPKNDTTWIVTAVITASLISIMILVSCLPKNWGTWPLREREVGGPGAGPGYPWFRIHRICPVARWPAS